MTSRRRFWLSTPEPLNGDMKDVLYPVLVQLRMPASEDKHRAGKISSFKEREQFTADVDEKLPREGDSGVPPGNNEPVGAG